MPNASVCLAAGFGGRTTVSGRKVGDNYAVPLYRTRHRELHHGGNEAAWWHDMGIDPLEVARQLWHETEGHRGPGFLTRE